MIINNNQLNDLDRLHYLKSSVLGEAQSLLASIPLVNGAFETAWTKLTERYENKMLLINTQLDRIFKTTQTTSTKETAKSLNSLINQIDTALSALKLLDQSTDNWDCVLVYHIAKQFSRNTLEKWEASICDTSGFPTFQQIKSFINSRVRTMEKMEAASTNTQRAPQSTSHHTAAQPSNTSGSNNKYICDCCFQNHFIVSCTQFRELPPNERLTIIKSRRLCYNCMGRHNEKSCKSTSTCRLCSQRHHTMLHGTFNTTTPSAQRPSSSTSAQPSTSTSN